MIGRKDTGQWSRMAGLALLMILLLFPLQAKAEAEGGERFSLPDLSTMSGAEQYLEGLGSLLELLGMGGTQISECKVATIGDQTYTGKSIRPVPKITYNGSSLKRGTDFTLKYTDNVKVGTAKVTITGKGNYTGTKTVSFKIVRKSSSRSGSSSSENSSGSSSVSKQKKFTVKLNKDTYTYDGKDHKPGVKVTLGGKTVPSSQYTVSYTNNKNVGKATVTVKGTGDYKGRTGTATFRIELKKISLESCTSTSEGTVKVTWKRAAQAQGYQIEYASDKSFGTQVKRETVKSAAKQSLVLEKLTGGKTYYVRIRTFKKVGASNWYSEWSTSRSVRVK